jgi:uncharacterized iron-regulated membrane protein
MTIWQRWLQRPQSVGARRALFQIHLWLGIGTGLYILTISVSGSAIVFRRDLGREYSRHAVVVAVRNHRMSSDELQKEAERRYPAYEVYSVQEPTAPDRPVEIVLGRGQVRMSRLFDPYTGEDLGDPRPAMDRALQWLADLHFNLLSGVTGRIVNGAGAFCLTLMCLTGAVLWWPGKRNWRRGISVRWSARFARLNFDLHSAIGFWCFFFVLIWGVSGVSLCFPGVLDPFVSAKLLVWLNRLHFGRFGWFAELAWTFLGMAPAVLFVTGAWMWWNRVLRRKLRSAVQLVQRVPAE